jgi:hypothetical protein
MCSGEDEGGAGDRPSHSEAFADATGECCFPGPEFTGEHNHISGTKISSEV